MTAEWVIEGVARCPACTLYLDIDETTLEDLRKIIAAHRCAPDRPEQD
jgi:hypothetical protein